ncbi:Gfo/Idh/MocA family oxidoreductase [Paracoccus subflavus]|uniref:Gfo/Idh/MocA family oxidoreductase n=2 Tax=Paracoccus subflavus TaxID=2528244 RepID=A0A4Q9FYS4_9RHOB|nr:Gfo/Idh/MocA family oxidoreductase [Paracoccus subflavus]
MLTLPSLRADPHVRLVACAAPRRASRDAFVAEFGGTAHEEVEALAADPAVEAVYVATPHQMHRAHAEAVARAGKHLLVEKPLAIALDDARAIVASAHRAGVHLITGPSHSFDQPVQRACEIIASGRLGRVRMMHALNFTDFLYRPRRPEELRTEEGGGVIFSQAVHQIDMLRLLAQAPARSVYAMTGAWDASRPTEGAYGAMIGFKGGGFANVTYSGYAHYLTDMMQDGIGELGWPVDPGTYGAGRRALASLGRPEDEAALKGDRTYGAVQAPPPASHAEHFGPVIVCCDRADLRLTPKGVEIWGDLERSFLPAPPDPAPRSPVLRALYRAIRRNEPPDQAAGWGLSSLEICHAILASARSGMPISLDHR